MANTKVTQKFNGNISITIKHLTENGYDLITPIVEDGVKWETERQGSPGKLTFKLYSHKNKGVNFEEGDAVVLTYKDNDSNVTLFNGYVFTKKRSKNGWINVTAYDQLRYFKNKMTHVYTEKKASDLINTIASQYNFKVGKIDDTGYTIAERVEDDQSIFDILQNALDLTLIYTGKMYVLYADNGKICCRNAENLKTDVVINKSVASDFEYTSSIDEETYTEVELYYDNDETNKREYYRAYDSTNMSRWGRLRLTENIQNRSNAPEKVKQQLSLYNRKTRKLTVKEAFGDYRCRAGASVIVDLDLDDITVNNYMLIEKATHTFKNGEYRMDLTLDGFNESDGTGNITYNDSITSYTLTINHNIVNAYGGLLELSYYDDKNQFVYQKKDDSTYDEDTKTTKIEVYKGTVAVIRIVPNRALAHRTTWQVGGGKNSSSIYDKYMTGEFYTTDDPKMGYDGIPLGKILANSMEIQIDMNCHRTLTVNWESHAK